MKLSKILIAFYTILAREVRRFIRIWKQTLVPPVINQFLYFIIFGAFIGSQIRDIQGVSYMAFIVPGLVMMAVITSSFMNVASSFYIMKFQRSIDEILVSPTPSSAIMWGYSLGGALRGILVGILVFIVSFIFTKPEIHDPLILGLFIFLTALVFALGGLINGILANKFDDTTVFSTFVLTPLTYFGGVFYSIRDLPEVWQAVSKFNPILYMVDGFRYGFYGIGDLDIRISLAVLIGFVLMLSLINITLLRRGVGLRS